MLLVDDADELIGCSYHEPWVAMPTGHSGRFLRFIALADEWQGATLPSGRRASEHLLVATLDDIRDSDPAAEAVGGKVDRGNDRSVRLLRSTGWTRYGAAGGRFDLYVVLL